MHEIITLPSESLCKIVIVYILYYTQYKDIHVSYISLIYRYVYVYIYVCVDIYVCIDTHTHTVASLKGLHVY